MLLAAALRYDLSLLVPLHLNLTAWTKVWAFNLAPSQLVCVLSLGK